jgi:hypothetical protein
LERTQSNGMHIFGTRTCPEALIELNLVEVTTGCGRNHKNYKMYRINTTGK